MHGNHRRGEDSQTRRQNQPEVNVGATLNVYFLVQCVSHLDPFIRLGNCGHFCTLRKKCRASHWTLLPALGKSPSSFLAPLRCETPRRGQRVRKAVTYLITSLLSAPEDKALLLLQGGRLGSFVRWDRRGYISGDKVPPGSSCVTTGSTEPLPSASTCLAPSLTVLI